MKIKSGIKLIEEQEGTGLAAQNGDQCVYHWKVFLNRGDEIPFDAINIQQFDEGLHPYRPRPITRSIGADTVIERKTTLGRRETLPFIHSTLRGMKGGWISQSSRQPTPRVWGSRSSRIWYSSRRRSHCRTMADSRSTKKYS